VVVMVKTRDWPAELRKPITMKELRNEVPEGGTNYEILQRYVAECCRRVALIRSFLKVSESESGNVLLVVKLCRYWEIPGFGIVDEPKRGPGAPKIWTAQKQCEVFADVMSLVKPPHVSEHRACQLLAEQGHARYEDMSAKTIHREFLRAKKTITGNPLFRARYFSQNEFDDMPMSGPDLIEVAIQRYAVAQNPKPHNNA
jgi:hypothetical protein